MDEHDKDMKRPVWREWQGWLGCVLASVMPTAVLASIVQMIEGQTAPIFVPALFIGLFTLMVLTIRPWTMR
jgi:hypothetical protein